MPAFITSVLISEQSLYYLIFCHIYRESTRTLNLFAGSNLNILICDQVLYACAFFHNRILHQDAVLNLSALGDLHAAEENAVLNLAFNHTAVSRHNILNLSALDIAGRVVVADLGVDGAWVEERIQVFIVQKLHVLVKVTLHVADAGHVARVQETVNF